MHRAGCNHRNGCKTYLTDIYIYYSYFRERSIFMRNIDEKQYEKYVKEITPTHSLSSNMLKAFFTGGTDLSAGTVYYRYRPLSWR